MSVYLQTLILKTHISLKNLDISEHGLTVTIQQRLLMGQLDKEELISGASQYVPLDLRPDLHTKRLGWIFCLLCNHSQT